MTLKTFAQSRLAGLTSLEILIAPFNKINSLESLEVLWGENSNLRKLDLRDNNSSKFALSSPKLRRADFLTKSADFDWEKIGIRRFVRNFSLQNFGELRANFDELLSRRSNLRRFEFSPQRTSKLSRELILLKGAMRISRLVSPAQPRLRKSFERHEICEMLKKLKMCKIEKLENFLDPGMTLEI